jgi:hypothetical protein
MSQVLPPIKPKERDAILQSLRAGVVPRTGLYHIQVGRKDEVSAVLQDFGRIADGGASIRFIIGRFGAGKSFFLNLARLVAMEQHLVVLQADITAGRRLHATGGQARALYTELMQNLAVRAKPDGGALPSVVEKWVSDVYQQLRVSGAQDADMPKAITERLRPLQDLVSGYDFAAVIARYFEGYQRENDALMQSALRWLRAEYTTKTEARQDLGVRSIIDDADIYDYLKLFAAFVRMAGYKGLLVNLDELGVLSHRLNNSQARNANYEMVLHILNDCLQGSVSGIGFMFAGTDAFLDDKRRGLVSSEALARRLADNSFAVDGMKDLSGPVIRLENLSPEDLYVLFYNIRRVLAMGDSAKYLVPDEALTAFLTHCSRTLGACFYQTPGDSVKAFVGFLSVLEQNPGADWRQMIEGVQVERIADPDAEPQTPDEVASSAQSAQDDDLATFTIGKQ